MQEKIKQAGIPVVVIAVVLVLVLGGWYSLKTPKDNSENIIKARKLYLEYSQKVANGGQLTEEDNKTWVDLMKKEQVVTIGDIIGMELAMASSTNKVTTLENQIKELELALEKPATTTEEITQE